MKPRFTDQLRYPNGYTPADRTDVFLTFKRIREELQAKLEKAEVNRYAEAMIRRDKADPYRDRADLDTSVDGRSLKAGS